MRTRISIHNNIKKFSQKQIPSGVALHIQNDQNDETRETSAAQYKLPYDNPPQHSIETNEKNTTENVRNVCTIEMASRPIQICI